jgi:hypothetical protein
MPGSNITIIRYTLILSLLGSFTLQGQVADIYAGVGRASYIYSEMKGYQQYLLKQLQTQGVKGTTIEDFPSYYTYFAGMHKHWQQWSLGFEVGHGSTGGRVYYEDYSGRYVADQTLKNYYIAVSPTLKIYKSKKIGVMGGGKITTTWSQAKLNHALTLGTTTVTDNATFQALNFGLQPYVLMRYYFVDKIFIQATLGYELQNSSELRKNDDHEVWLDDGSGHAVHLQGNGYRLGLGIGVAF